MALSTVADVKRVMQITDNNPTRDAQLGYALEAAESWFAERSVVQWDASGTGTAEFFDVPETSEVMLPVPVADVTEVRRDGSPLGATSYDVINGRYVRLRPFLEGGAMYPYGTGINQWSVGRRFMQVIRKLEIDYEVTASPVPYAVRDGVARLAGYLWQTGPRDPLTSSTRLKSETLGGYSYTLAEVGGASAEELPDGVKEAMFLLKPYLRHRAAVSVT